MAKLTRTGINKIGKPNDNPRVPVSDAKFAIVFFLLIIASTFILNGPTSYGSIASTESEAPLDTEFLECLATRAEPRSRQRRQVPTEGLTQTTWFRHSKCVVFYTAFSGIRTATQRLAPLRI